MALETTVVGISDMAVSGNPAETLITYSLGSCLGVTIYDPVARVGGLIHCMLPLSSVDEKRAHATPAMFVDVGVPLFLEKALRMGADKKRLVLKAAGCAQLLDPEGLFRIGERNFALLRKLLWKNGILIKAQDIGGMVSRTVSLDVSTGKTFVRAQGETREL